MLNFSNLYFGIVSYSLLYLKCFSFFQGFLTAIGSRNKRMAMSLEHTLAPVVHGAISTFMGIIMLAGAEFDFIIK
jgi:hypothetical protein